jgi:hypothetical protein
MQLISLIAYNKNNFIVQYCNISLIGEVDEQTAKAKIMLIKFQSNLDSKFTCNLQTVQFEESVLDQTFFHFYDRLVQAYKIN